MGKGKAVVLKARRWMSWAQILFGISGTVMAVLALLRKVDWAYSIALLAVTAVLAGVCLIYDIERFRRGKNPYQD